jgi:signal transduction histidine kinase
MRPLRPVRHLTAATKSSGEPSVDVLASLGEAVDGLCRLTEDLLVLARLDAGAPETVGRAVHLDDLMTEKVWALVTPDVTVDTKQVSAAQVIGHREQLRRVVSNLLDNAVRHAASGRLPRRGRRVVTFAVIDDGPGIPPAQCADVFECFRRLDDARSGTGLGLAIARDLVAQHGGSIAIDPGPPAGTRFVVMLPAG